jgi:triacylglycerol lipase
MMTFPILLVHGIFDTGARFSKMQTALCTRGFDKIHAMNIIPPDASIPMEAMASQVQAEVRALQQSTGTAKVDIVAFSMGTLVVRYFLQKMGGRSDIRHFVSISGPHHGTWTAYLGWNVGSRQMRPGSAFLQELNSESDPWGEVKVFSFWTPYDRTVIPPSSSILPGTQNRTFNVLIHHWMLSDKQVIEAVAGVLGAP